MYYDCYGQIIMARNYRRRIENTSQFNTLETTNKEINYSILLSTMLWFCFIIAPSTFERQIQMIIK